MRSCRLGLVVVPLLAVACSSGTLVTVDAGDGTDAGVDAIAPATDSGARDGSLADSGNVDAGTDAARDATIGTDSGTGADATVDAGTDSGHDSGSSQTQDAAADAGTGPVDEAGVDAGTDAAEEGGVDASPEAEADAAPDASEDAAGSDDAGDASDADPDTRPKNVVVFSNYDGGDLVIDVDEDIPNLKIGVVSYEAVKVTITGTYAGNVTEVRYAGYNGNNRNCGPNIATTSFVGVDPGITSNNFMPGSPLSNPNGYSSVICAYSCSTTTSQGGCNTVDQVDAYFDQTMGRLRHFVVQYGCWTGTRKVSDGGNCVPR
ncbi:MAG: hypothetical protein U0169_10850 [Polyangiaceae bacterium]